MSVPASRRKTAADLAAMPGDPRAEVIDGEIVPKADPTAEHSDAQTGLATWVRRRFGRGGGGGPRRPGGWWILAEVEIGLETHEVYRPDLAGWRRDRAAEKPRGRPVNTVPGWVCEVLSRSNARNDLVTKFRAYRRSRVQHYWIADPDDETLVVYRWNEGGYLAILTAKKGETVRAEPFDAIDLPVGVLFGEDDPEG